MESTIYDTHANDTHRQTPKDWGLRVFHEEGKVSDCVGKCERDVYGVVYFVSLAAVESKLIYFKPDACRLLVQMARKRKLVDSIKVGMMFD
jgi:hypothetical protein